MSNYDADIRLSAAVERCYLVFAHYRPGEALATCRCWQCMNDETERQLLTTPLRDIDPMLLAEYTWSANGRSDLLYSSNELRYFLPRYFDLISRGDYPCHGDFETTLRQLGRIGYRANWPVEEVTAVDGFFDALIEAHVSRAPKSYVNGQGAVCIFTEVADVLCLAARGGGDMARMLKAWELSTNDTATLHMACLIRDAHRSVEVGSLFPGPYWDDFKEAGAALRAWLFRLIAVDRLETVCTAAVDGVSRDLLDAAKGYVLEWIKMETSKV